ncbi:hypothetical protein B0T25DRAFT_466704 [Lasiosphaeria hispida]|uniref:Uncharacterized protein n=1 Tax=Lasiosphaeria hispida TaxID=260671 RepID=A0AAJ0H5G7_9PEZI|nr:hypothetical protein B0T25DRAFT_466704 [Lasiosphaeria hispida]
MIIVHPSNQPIPMDWIFDLCTYGMKIAMSTPSKGRLSFNGLEVTYSDVTFQMNCFIEMLYHLMEEIDGMMGQLTFLSILKDKMPPILWDKLSDNSSQDKVSYLFLTDPKNQ